MTLNVLLAETVSSNDSDKVIGQHDDLKVAKQ